MEYVSKFYPSIFIFVARDILKRNDKVDQYMQKCYDLEDNLGEIAKQSMFIHGYWFPYLDKLIKAS